MNIMNQVIGSLVPLGLICLIVTFGNLLVISAVRYYHHQVLSFSGIIILRYYHCQVLSSSGIIVRYYHRKVLSSSGIIIVRYNHRQVLSSSGIIIIAISAVRYQSCVVRYQTHHRRHICCQVSSFLTVRYRTYHHQVIMITP